MKANDLIYKNSCLLNAETIPTNPNDNTFKQCLLFRYVHFYLKNFILIDA